MKRFLRTILILFLIYSMLSFVVGLILDTDQEVIAEEEEEYYHCDEYSYMDSTQIENIRVVHNRSWNKYSFDSLYCLSYSLSAHAPATSYEFRNRLSTQERIYEKYWRNVYFELYQHDAEALSFLQDSLQNIADRNGLTRNDFAKLIVSFVQDIPYNYVVPGPCERNDHPCRSNEKFGILSPVEFLYSLSGDCDTRSVDRKST
ncbi:MAG: hypothetical protein RIA63_02340, partial [Cyclobacteriaceae bacterium]